MSYCLNPACTNPQNADGIKFCTYCGTKLLLKDRYRAIRPIGQGGFGKTFLAVDEDKPSKPKCVIKQFYPQAQGTSTVQKAAELFTQEAVRLDELGEHPQIPDLYAYFTQDDRQYLVQEFIDGQNLAQELAANGVFSESQIRQFLIELLQVLEFVHSHQVIHRDIKPENIIRRQRDQLLFLVDFGASKFAVAGHLNHTGTSIGSPEYVAPEQVRGKATFSSDLYSLGVTCVHLLTQMSPFDLYDYNNDEWLWRSHLKTPISTSLASILDRMLQTAPNRRYQLASEVLRDLNQSFPPTVPQPNITNVAPPTIISQPKPTPPPLASPHIKTVVDEELAALQAEFLGTGNNANPVVKPPAKPSPMPPTPNKITTQVDLELEEVKSQFLTPPKKPGQ